MIIGEFRVTELPFELRSITLPLELRETAESFETLGDARISVDPCRPSKRAVASIADPGDCLDSSFPLEGCSRHGPVNSHPFEGRR